MKTITPYLVFTGAAALLAFNGCQKQTEVKAVTPTLPAQPYNYQATAFFNMDGDNTPVDNTVTNDGATLGRVLFYDPRLSINNTISCASCHKQQNAFADNVAFSNGFDGKTTQRNTPAIINAANKSVFFWDGRTSFLETQTLMPIKNHIEMGMEKIDVLPTKLAAAGYYSDLFQKAFGTPDITPDRISRALAQFVRSMVSGNSRADQGQLTSQERNGRIVFLKYHCSSCHIGNNLGGAPMTTSYEGTPESVPNSANIGLDVEYVDGGIGSLNNNSSQTGQFIIPSLRNLVYTAPYMHDGRYKTLGEVVEHYNSGILPSPNLDPALKQGSFTDLGIPIVDANAPVKMNMTPTEKSDLVAYLKALSDPTIVNSPMYSNPFK